MKRCIDLALSGSGQTAPNPMVGCVIVHNNKITGEGFHKKYGEPHAEVNAINSVKDKNLLKESSLYVNLEPCSHQGKTPPCCDYIIKYKIPEVYIGCRDTNPMVSGQGIEKLKASGCKVFKNILEKECRFVNRRFFTAHEKKRPYIVLKWAQTTDGFIDKIRNKEQNGQPTWISDELSRVLVHQWRAEEQAILVGINTVIKDNPKLTTRDWKGHDPVRIIIDPDLRTPANSNILDNTAPTFIINNHRNELLKNTEYIKLAGKENMVKEICDLLYQKKIISVIIEGGRKTIQSFIDESLWDEARVITAPAKFKQGVPSPWIKSIPSETKIIEKDKLEIYYL